MNAREASAKGTRWPTSAAVVIALLLLSLIAFFSLTAGAVIERGDGVNHYLIARWSWTHPELLLDHWGKPLFTLLASPFAQFGMHGVVFFNMLVSFVAVLFAIRILKNAGVFATIAYPVLLLMAPLHVLMILAGMTEPLFGSLTVIVVSLFHSGRYATGTILASFLPFVRPEFIAFLPFVGVWLILAKCWSHFPLLATGWVLYSIAGWLAVGDFNWYLNTDPYSNGPSIYGSGDPWTFTRGLDSITGRPLMVFFLVGLLAWPYLRWKDREDRRTADMVLVLCALPAIAILIIHMTLWGLGIKCSAGILRVVATAVPLAALFAAYVLSRLLLISIAQRALAVRPVILLVVALVVWSAVDFNDRQLLPIKANSDEQALRTIGSHIAHDVNAGAKLFTTHPFMAICADVDPFDPARYEMTYGYESLGDRMRPGDILFWDTELGPNESGIPFDSLWRDTELEVVAMAEPSKGHKVIRDVYYELYAFRRAEARRSMTIDTLISSAEVKEGIQLHLDTVDRVTPNAGWHFAKVQQPMIIEGVPVPPQGVLCDEFIVCLDVRSNLGERQQLALIYDQVDGKELVRTRQEELQGGKEEIHLRVTPTKGTVSHSFRLVDPGHHGCGISGFSIVRHRWSQQLP